MKHGLKQFEITYYWGPHGENACDERFVSAIAECGFTSIPLENNTAENNKKALTVMKKYGLTCSALWDRRIYDIVYGKDADPPQETVDAAVAETAADYAGFDNVRGWWLCDEPNASRFRLLGKVADAFHRLDPGRTVSINLFPTYASPKQLGNPTYGEHLAEYIRTVHPDYLSYDHYHFTKNGPRPGFFTNMEAVRDAALRSGLDAMCIILLTEHMCYENLTPEQIRWEVNMCLAYGMRRLSYFTFILDRNLLDDGWNDSCMNYLGEKYPHYTVVREINRWLLPLGRELFPKTSTAVYHLDDTPEPDCVPYPADGPLGPVGGTGFVIGCFDDGSLMAVNKKTAAGTEGRNILTLEEPQDRLEYFDPTAGCWLPAADCPRITHAGRGCRIAPEAGEGLLLRKRK